MNIESTVMLTGIILIFLVLPFGTWYFKRDHFQKMMKWYALLATLFVSSLIAYRAFIVEAHVPKPRYHKGDVIKMDVQAPVSAEFLMEVAKKHLPMCAFEFTQKPTDFETACAAFNGTPGENEFTAVKGSRDHNPKLRFITDQTQTFFNGKEEVPVGEMTAACAMAPWTLDETEPGSAGDLALIWAHELGHLCGYEHAVGDPTSPNVRFHLMSTTIDTLSTDNTGMDHGNSELYLPVVE
jgi:hypothetical protein